MNKTWNVGIPSLPLLSIIKPDRVDKLVWMKKVDFTSIAELAIQANYAKSVAQ